LVSPKLERENMGRKKETEIALPDDGRRQETAPPAARTYGGWKERFRPAKGTPLNECPTSLDLNDAMHRKILFNALQQSTLELGDHGVIIMDVNHYVVHPVEITDPDTGEVSDALRAVFIRPDGATFATTSEVIVGRLADMLSLFDGTHFDGVVRVRIEERKARRSKRTYHSLTFAMEGE
jgi:hypothetical protein